MTKLLTIRITDEAAVELEETAAGLGVTKSALARRRLEAPPGVWVVTTATGEIASIHGDELTARRAYMFHPLPGDVQLIPLTAPTLGQANGDPQK